VLGYRPRDWWELWTQSVSVLARDT
jgi:hypothetical protein